MIIAKLIETPTEITQDSIKVYIAECSSVVRNKTPKDNNRLFDRLLKESFGSKASRVLEYLPCAVYHDGSLLNERSKYYGFQKDPTDFRSNIYYTTARELLNWGWTLEEILPTIDFTHYRVVRVTAPRFIYNQLQTHDNVTSVSFSARYDKSTDGKDYWMPPEFEQFANIEAKDNDEYTFSFGKHNYVTGDTPQILWNNFVECYSPKQLKSFMKDILKVGRPEIWNRGADSLEYVEFTLGSFTNHLHYWEHFCSQIYIPQDIQLETRETVAIIANIIGLKPKEL